MDPEQSRQAIETILDRARDLNERSKNVEILNVNNHCDGAFLQQKLERENHPCANQVKEMLKWNGGARYSSGVGISNIDFNGNVHADQFSMFRSFGNV
jgi:MoaA/NifB/PqqE/SkfB family radical SAM enzyme